jgi:hypothetical protein
MREIYSNATKTLVWLGAGESRFGEAFELVSNFGGLDAIEANPWFSDLSLKEFNGLVETLGPVISAPYWRRV